MEGEMIEAKEQRRKNLDEVCCIPRFDMEIYCDDNILKTTFLLFKSIKIIFRGLMMNKVDFFPLAILM